MRGHDSQSAHICNWGAADRRAETAAQHFRRGECRSRNRYNRLFAQAGGECSPPPGKGLAGPYPPSRNLSAGRTKRGGARGGGQRQAPAMDSEWDRGPQTQIASIPHSDRKSVVEGKSGTVRVELGGRCCITTYKNTDERYCSYKDTIE